jgi:hypothetical protein
MGLVQLAPRTHLGGLAVALLLLGDRRDPPVRLQPLASSGCRTTAYQAVRAEGRALAFDAVELPLGD